MEKYLYRISTKRTDVWSRKEPKPVYFVADSKEAAAKWAVDNLAEGLSMAIWYPNKHRSLENGNRN